MKTCTYCGRENDDALAVCRECGTELTSAEPASPAPSLSRRGRIVVGVVLLLLLGVAVISMPMLLLVVPLFALFYLPIYLPFLLSFFIRAHEWRGMRWSLRVGSVLALFIRLSGMSSRPANVVPARLDEPVMLGQCSRVQHRPQDGCPVPTILLLLEDDVRIRDSSESEQC